MKCNKWKLSVILTVLFCQSALGQVASFTISVDQVCTGNSVLFTNTSTGATNTTTYQWDFGEGAIPSTSESSESVSVVYDSPGVKTITLAITSEGADNTAMSQQITVYSPPNAYAGDDLTLDYIFDITLNATLEEGESGRWQLIEGNGEFANENSANTHLNGLSIGQNVLLWTVSNEVCPESQDYLTIIVNDLILPSLITPNNDGRNDYFVLKGIESLGAVELIIFDRRGVEMYKNDKYKNEWNGVDQNGNVLPDGTYFYSMKFSQRKRPVSGYLVIRK